MNSNDISPDKVKEKQVKACPYLGLLQDSQTTLAFPSTSNLCYHAKPLVSPSLEYQRSFCLNGRQHTHCPVFIRRRLAPLPSEISGSHPSKPLFGKPIKKQVILPILLGCVVLILGVIGVLWLSNNHHGSTGALTGELGSPAPFSNEPPLSTATFLITNIPITPNLDESAITGTDTPLVTASETGTPLPTQTPTRIGITPVPVHTLVPCGSPNNWVVYIVQPGDSLFRISQIYGVTVAELQRANCLGTSTTLHTGQILYVPPWSPVAPSSTPPILVLPTSTSINTPTDTQVFIPPSDTPIPATQPPVDTDTPVPPATDVPTDTPVSP